VTGARSIATDGRIPQLVHGAAAVAQIIRAEKLAPSRCIETHPIRAVTVLASELLFLTA